MPDASSDFDADDLPGFDYDPRTRVVFGSHASARLGELALEYGARNVLLVTDHGLLEAGHAERCRASLSTSGLNVTVFSDVHPNPTTDDVGRGLEIARQAGIDFLVAVGGGSSMDCAKGINFLLTNGGRMQDYHGSGKAKLPMLPLIAVPTTAGTGSEAQSYAIIADAVTHMKMACGDRKAACRVAVLDPELTVSMPAGVTAAGGIDAISHAIESYVTTRRNPISQLFSRRAWRLLSAGFPGVLKSPGNVKARGAMLLGSHLAGAAIENSMLGATHALSNPVTAHFGVTHGIAIGVLLPHVIRYNSSVVGGLYGRLAADIGLCDARDPSAGNRLAGAIAGLVRTAGMPSSLEACDVDPALIPQMAGEAAKQWTGAFNPRPVDATSLEELYRCAFSRCD